ncbi:hypothetical protein PS15p_201090 [Mucor circinelloides]
MFGDLYPHHRFIPCAPQTAVVMHPAVSVFITHGGAGSFYEGLYAGKRLAVFPLFGDQFPNAHNVEHNDIGVYLNYELNQEQMNILDCRDSDENYQKDVNRYKGLIQIHYSRDDCVGAADLVEEVSFVNKQGQLPYRYEASRQMSFIKAKNIDLYAVSAGIVPNLTLLSVLLCRHTLKSRKNHYSQS